MEERGVEERKRSPRDGVLTFQSLRDRATYYKMKCYAFTGHKSFKKATQLEQRGQELSTKSLGGFGKGPLSPDVRPLRGVLCEALC